MINVKLIRKKGGSQSAGRSTGGNRYTGGARSTDYATEAGHAKEADHSKNADNATLAAEATHAASSADLDKESSVWTTIKGWIDTLKENCLKWFLRKDIDDTASGLITFLKGFVSKAIAKFLKGFTIGTDGKYGIDENGVATLAELVAEKLRSSDFRSGYFDGSGFGVYKDGNTSVAEIDRLYVRMKAVFAELEIRKLSYVGGDQVHSFAGSTLQKVVPLDKSGNVITDGSKANAFKCYFVDDDGTTMTENWWKIGDQARCQTFNIQDRITHNASNRYYWRLVVETGTEEQTVNGEKRNVGYAVLSNDVGGFTLKNPDDPTKNIQDKDGKDIVFIGMQSTDKDTDPDNPTTITNDDPMAEDKIVQLGSQCDEERSYAYIEYVTEQKRVDYYGINTYSLNGCAVEQHSPHGGFVYTKWFEMRVGNPDTWHPFINDRGDYDDNTEFSYYDSCTLDGSRWLHIGKESTTGVRPSDDDTVWQLIVAGFNDSSSIELKVYCDNDKKLAWNDSCTLTCKVVKGTRDLTDTVTYWKVERDSGDSASDALWSTKDKVRNFAGSLLLVTGEEEDDIGNGTSAKFTFTASDKNRNVMAKKTITIN